jgi:hypothetical protein
MFSGPTASLRPLQRDPEGEMVSEVAMVTRVVHTVAPRLDSNLPK